MVNSVITFDICCVTCDKLILRSIYKIVKFRTFQCEYSYSIPYSVVAPYIRDRGGLGLSGQKYHPKTSFTILPWCFGCIG